MPSPRALASTVLAPLLLVGGAGGVLWLREHRPVPAVVRPKDPGPIPVRVVALRAGPVEHAVEAYGTLLPARRARLAPEVGGRVTAVHPGWRPGARVAAGTELLRVDDALPVLDLRAAEAALSEAEALAAAARLDVRHARARLAPAAERRAIAARELERAVGLGDLTSASALDRVRAEDTASAQLLQRAEQAVEAAESAVGLREASAARARVALDRAREQLDRCALVAPFDGELVDRPPDPGTHLLPGAPVAEIVDRGALLLRVGVPETDVAGVFVGQDATVTVPARPGERWSGRVDAVGVEADPASRTVPVEVRVENGPGPGRADANGAGGLPVPLAAGQFARASIRVGRSESALVVMRDWLVWDGASPRAFVAEADPAGGWVLRERRPRLGRETGAGFVVEAGLGAGDRLVTYPLDRARDGARAQEADR